MIWRALLTSLTLAGTASASAQPWLDTEFGMAFAGYCDIRVPGDTGTEFSLLDLDPDPALFARVRPGITLGRHNLSLLVAPLRIEAASTLESNVSFSGTLFPAGAPVDATYRFDSYRLSWMYEVYRRDDLTLAAGASAKIRDAAISLSSPALELSATKTNTGFVPLLTASADYGVSPEVQLRLHAAGLVGPVGRAEDVFAGIVWTPSPVTSLRAGYRFVEGGADVDEVYNFTMIHYASLGATVAL
jgi:hypothetical protein